MMEKKTKKTRKLIFRNKISLPFWQRLSTHINLYNLFFSFLFVITSITISFLSSRQVILDDTNSLLISVNQNKSNHFCEWIRSNEESILSFSQRPLLIEDTEMLIDCMEQGGDCGVIEKRLLENHLNPKASADSDFDGFFLMRASDGMVISGTDSSLIGKYQENEDFFIEGLKSGYTEPSAFHFTKGQAVMHTAVPVRTPDGTVIAVLSGHLNLEIMYGIIGQRSESSETEDSYLVNNFNYFLTEPRYGENYALRRSVFSDGVKECLAGNSGVAEYTDYRGVAVIGAYQWLPEQEICMVSEKDRSEVFAPIIAERNIFILVGSVLFCASVFGGYLLSRRITNPIHDLDRMAMQVSRGNLSARVEISSKNELGLLAATLNQMSANLQKAQEQNQKLVAELQVFNDELEARVEDRTRDLRRARFAAEKSLKDLEQETASRMQAQLLLAEKARDLQRSNEDLQRFAYVASHDLQEPLRMVASYLQLLEQRYQDALDEDAREFIHYAVDGATRMKNLIDDLLDFSRVGTRANPFEPTDLNTILGKVRANLQMRIEEENAVVVSEELPTIPADPPQMIQLFQNLIDNAIKFRAEDPPRVHIKAKEAEQEWVISVSDNGIGIDPQYFDRIFVIFQRLHTRTQYPGTGIGLAVGKRIVERHNGRIWVESAPGGGTTFYCALPKKHEEKQKPSSQGNGYQQ